MKPPYPGTAADVAIAATKHMPSLTWVQIQRALDRAATGAQELDQRMRRGLSPSGRILSARIGTRR